jgi:cytochrome c2
MKKIYLFLILIFFVVNIILNSSSINSEEKGEYLLPGSVKEGWKVFNSKKCNACHSIWGEGGKGGPDLGDLPESFKTPSELATLIWNHGPSMWGRMATKKIPYQKIDKKEMTDLFAFLYFLRYMEEPGNPLKGKKIFESTGCGKCHQLKEGVKEDLRRWAMYVNPILWAQMMWNHAPQMEKEMKLKQMQWIKFKGNEMVDLIAYIRSLNPGVEKVYLSPGDPISGEAIFRRKGCLECHRQEGKISLLKTKEFPGTLTQLAGAMWNHFPEMWKEIEEKGMERPVLSAQEMADLVAYLFSIKYFDPPGNAIRGRSIFMKKRCDLCHIKGGKGPDLKKLKRPLSSISIAQSIWNHGPEMWEEMIKAKIPWERINHQELIDLMEYLNRGIN